MTERRILTVVRKVEAARETGHNMEALLKLHHLNVALLKHLCAKVNAPGDVKGLRPKQLAAALVSAHPANPAVRKYIGTRNTKALKPWITKMDKWLKTIKTKDASNTKPLILDSFHVFTILRVSFAKLNAMDETTGSFKTGRRQQTNLTQR
jgi:hypothetical protein